MTKQYNSLVISDIHLGSKVLNHEKLLKVLNTVKFDNLIINGDLFDDFNFHRLNTEHWTILSKIREFTKTHKVIFIEGNHDIGAKSISDLIGTNHCTDYVLVINKKKIIITHGQIFDYYIIYQPFITWLFTGIYYLIQKFGGKRQRMALFLKHKSKTWLKIHEKLRVRAIKFAKNHSGNVILCGHSHIAESHKDEDSNILYINSGSFCDKICHFITIDKSGNCELKEI